MDQPKQEEFNVEVRWEDERPDPRPANQSVVHKTPAGEIILTFGFISPPVFASSAEQKKKQIEELTKSGITVKVCGTVVLTLKTAEQLYAALGQQLEK